MANSNPSNISLRAILRGLSNAVAGCDPRDRLALGEVHKQLSRLHAQLESENVLDQLGSVSFACQLAEHLMRDGKVTAEHALPMIETVVAETCTRMGIECAATRPVAEPADESKSTKKGGGLQMLSSRKLGEIMVQLALLDSKQVERALAYQHKKRCRLGEALIELGMVSKEAVQQALKVQSMRTGANNNKNGPWRIGA
jgi:hypothetical protein